jgi:uncharacterized protein YcbK (DUF882 family)
VLALGLLLGVAGAGEPPEPRFFTHGSGRLALRNLHSGAEATVRYRRADGTYDGGALERLRRVLRSRDGRDGPIEPRFVELLGWLYDATGSRTPLRIQSAYRSPAYNEAIRARGAKAASASLHTEGMAADVAIERRLLAPLWQALRARECCGAGYYPSGGFLHVDVGTPRFWDERTSRVDENLSAGNARVFARTDFDRYAPGDVIQVRLHALTVPPLRLARTARLDVTGAPVTVTAPAAAADGCVEVDARTVLLLEALPPTERSAVVFTTCAPRPERTPEMVRTNPVVIGD